MPIKLGPAGVPLSCKGRTIVEGMDDIISLGLETMEVQTVRMVAPQHFEQYWQAGVLANKTDFEMNIHYSKRATLAAVYSATLLAFLSDDSGDMAKTEAFLDRRLRDVSQIPKVTKPAKAAVSKAASLVGGIASQLISRGRPF